MKVANLKEGMLLAVSNSEVRPVARIKEPDRLTFFPDIFAQIGFGNVIPLDHKSYFFYVGKRKEVIPEEFTAIGTPRTKSHHEVMDKNGLVYKVHGREFKNFEPVWREDENRDN